MMVNLVIVVFSAAFFVYTHGTDVTPNFNKLTGAQDTERDVLNIMQKHFDSSLDYLYTGVQYDSQYGERPGLAKKLRGMSDAEWDAGMSALNKFIEKGGSTDQAFVSKLHFQGGDVTNMGRSSKGQMYAETLKLMATKSQEKLDLYNPAYSRAVTNNDGDMAHYLEEKIEKEVEHLHKMNGHMTTFKSMQGIGAAVAAFDSNL